MVFNGRAFARERLAALQEERKAFGALSIGIVVASSDPVTSSYVKIKERNAHALDIKLHRYSISEEATEDEALEAVREAHQHDGVIVQLPLPFGIESTRVINAIQAEKDLDVISAGAGKRFESGEHLIMPPVASAINEIIDTFDIATEGKRAVVVGKGKLVGRPAFHLLSQRGALVVSLDTKDDIHSHVRTADILVLGAGSPHLIQPEMVRKGVVVFDAGTSESGGALVGDAAPEVSQKASFFTPVPGGIGPVAVVEIFGNLLVLQKNRQGT